MLYASAQEFLDAPHKSLTLFGMSGVGKTTIANRLPRSHWFHYSVDYRIGTRYLGEDISDMFKRMLMHNPIFAQLLRSDSIYIGSNIRFDNLAPLSAYVGMLGDPSQGGIPLAEFKQRQARHRQAEIAALTDVQHFKQRAQQLYGYPHFLLDSGGSLIEVVDLDDPFDPVIKALTQHTTPIYIEAGDALLAQTVARGVAAPKPMYYPPDFLDKAVARYLAQQGLDHADDMQPKAFVAWVLAELMYDRAPRYRRLAERHGYIIQADAIADIETEDDFLQLVAQAITQANDQANTQRPEEPLHHAH